VIVEENSTFDHVFGYWPTADGVGIDDNISQAGGRTVQMNGFSELGPAAFTVPHGEEVLSNGSVAARQSYDGGKMDGFYRAQVAAGKRPRLSFTLIDPGANPPWGSLASQGVVFDRYFSSEMAGSLPNTLNLVAGTTAGRNTGASAEFRSLWHSHITTIFDAADEKPDVSWRYYIGGLGQIDEHKVANGAYARSGQATPSQLYWAPVLSMKRFWTDPASRPTSARRTTCTRTPPSGNLPNISYILPQPTSHEPQVEGRTCGSVGRERDPDLADWPTRRS
jgi:phospholipase C